LYSREDRHLSFTLLFSVLDDCLLPPYCAPRTFRHPLFRHPLVQILLVVPQNPHPEKSSGFLVISQLAFPGVPRRMFFISPHWSSSSPRSFSSFFSARVLCGLLDLKRIPWFATRAASSSYSLCLDLGRFPHPCLLQITTFSLTASHPLAPIMAPVFFSAPDMPPIRRTEVHVYFFNRGLHESLTLLAPQGWFFVQMALSLASVKTQGHLRVPTELVADTEPLIRFGFPFYGIAWGGCAV